MKFKLILIGLQFLMLGTVLVLLDSCDGDITVAFRATIIGTDNRPVKSGEIVIYGWKREINKPNKTVLQFSDGSAMVEVPVADKYVVNFHARGYGLVSKVYYGTLPEATYTLKLATLYENFNPAAGGQVKDAGKYCGYSLSGQVDWDKDARKDLAIRLNSEGEVMGFGMDPELQETFDAQRSRPCASDITINIQPNALTTSSPVTVAMTAIDLYSPDGMPGDYSSNTNGQQAIMESFGAITVEVYDSDKHYNLREDTKVEAVFPLSSFISDSLGIQQSVPILYYNEETGEWNGESMATYDPERKAYVAMLEHFSAINLDLEKVTPACVRVRDIADGLDPDFSMPTSTTYRVEVTVPPVTTGAVGRVSYRNITPNDMNCFQTAMPPDIIFALTRLPQNTFVSVVFYNLATPPSPYATYVIKTGPTNSALINPMSFGCINFDKCGTALIPFDKGMFAVGEILLSACLNPATSEMRVNLALMPSITTFTATDYKLRVDRAPDGSPVPAACTGSDITLPTATLISPASAKVKIYQFVIPYASLCHDPANPTLEHQLNTVKLVKSSDGSDISNAFLATSCN